MTSLSPIHILVVDDDRRLRELLMQFLSQQGYYVSVAKDTTEARALMQLFSFDALVVDVMMPGETGMVFTKAIRPDYPNLPILMLTAMGDVEHRIEGLESGVDDYLSKPFEPKELTLRLEAIMRRQRATQSAAEKIRFGEYCFDLAREQLHLREALIPLTTTETTILAMLAKHHGEVVRRERLLSHVTAQGNQISERAIDVQINRLRQKIGESGKPRYLLTVWGEGYKLVG
jgi:two-component system phosphate regulon response regulator OmpR